MDLWNGVTLTMACTDPARPARLQEHIIQKKGGGAHSTLFQNENLYAQ